MAAPSPLANIGPKGQRQRRLLGAAAVVAGIVVFILLSRSGMARWWRVALFPFWVVAALGFLQAQARTCVVLAAQGTCDGEIARHLDDIERGALARQAKSIVRRVALIAAALTVLALALPA